MHCARIDLDDLNVKHGLNGTLNIDLVCAAKNFKHVFVVTFLQIGSPLCNDWDAE